METTSAPNLPDASHLINKEANLPNTTELIVAKEGSELDKVSAVIHVTADPSLVSPPDKLAGPAGGMKTASAVTSKQPASVLPTAKVAVGVGATKPTLAAAVNRSVGAGLAIPKGLTGIDTSNISPDTQDYFHGIIYAQTSARKTTTAANMYGPENTIIVLCRQPEQLIPLRGMGFKVLHAQTAEALVFALSYPEVAAEKLLNWPEWKDLKDRTLVFDDISEGVTLLLDRHSTNDEGKERKDPRAVYKFAGGELKEMFVSLRRKKLHLVIIALAKITMNDFTNEEVIGPDLPPSMNGFMTTDVEFVFYIDKSKWKFVTDEVYRSYVGKDEKGKDKVFKRVIFGKNKVPLKFKFLSQPVFPPTNEVSMDLAKIWKSVREGKPIEGGGVK